MIARRRRRAEQGVTVVEAAFALPILLTFIFGLVDLGMWTFNANQATNAARDGARLAILDYQDADDETSSMRAAIVDAVRSRLEADKVDSVMVSCVDDTGSAIACSTAEVDVDSVRVDVEWTWDLITPVAAILGYDEGEATGSATMKLVGRPLPGSTTAPTSSTSTTTTTSTSTPDDSTSTTTTTTPAACAVSSITIPTSVSRGVDDKGKQTSQLAEPVLVEFRTNGSTACNDLRVEIRSTEYNPSGKGSVEVDCGCDLTPPEPQDFRWSYDGSDNIWSKSGTATVIVRNGTTALLSKTFTVT